MEDSSDKGENQVQERSRVRPKHLMATAVLILGVLSVSMLVWIDQIHRKGDASYHLADAIMDVQIKVAKSHLELEEGYHGDRPARSKEASVHLAQAAALCGAILNGGESEYGRILSPLQDPELRVRIEEISDDLSELRMIVRQHYQDPAQDGSALHWDERYDAISTGMLNRADAAEVMIEQGQERDKANARRLLYGILFAWSGVVIASTTGLYSRERQRRAAQRALLAANANLERQTEELRRHREHLTELVDQGTMGLRDANRSLETEVCERRLAEQALRISEEKYRMLIETMNEGLAILDTTGVLTYVNDKFCTMLGYSRNELLLHPCTEFVPSESDRKTISDNLQLVSRHDRNRFEVAFRTKDGQEVFTMVSSKGTYGEDGRAQGCFAVITDITERITLQAATVRAAHLASLGELAAGVAHEINNPTNGIINYAQMLLDKSDGGSPERDIANRIHKEGRRIADIVRSLLLFARGGAKEKIAAGLDDILSNSLDLTGSQLKKDGIEIQFSMPAGLPRLIADPQEIQQVFVNIISNARYALNQKYPGVDARKILQISAERVELGESLYVRTTFYDSGIGIPAQIIHKIQEPFYSTKPKGRGTGLGLSISLGIINEHGGQLSIESAEGEFTRVIIELPAKEGCNGATSCN